MSALSVGEWLFLAIGVGGFARFGWCLVWLIGTEEPMPAWLDLVLDVAVGLVLSAMATARRKTGPVPFALLVPTSPEVSR